MTWLALYKYIDADDNHSIYNTTGTSAMNTYLLFILWETPNKINCYKLTNMVTCFPSLSREQKNIIIASDMKNCIHLQKKSILHDWL